MEYKSLYIRGLSQDEWKRVFSYILNEADSFKIYFPNGDEEILNIGKNSFESLSNIKVRNWEGMQDSMEVRGELTNEIRNIFMEYEAPSVEKQGDKLWSFRLYKGNRELMYIGDFTDKIIHLTDEEIMYLNQLGIKAENWDLIKINREESDDLNYNQFESVDLFNVQYTNDSEV